MPQPRTKRRANNPRASTSSAPAPRSRVAMAIAAHPDDIEFLMAGTLVRLRQVGCEVHYLNVASGSCGSAVESTARVRQRRRAEAQAAAAVIGAVFHPSLVDDLELYYERRTLRRLAALIREVAPDVLLVPSPQDYMEDHTNTCRLAVTAAFVRGMRNFVTEPRRAPVGKALTVYHAMPHGLRDPLRRRILPGLFVNTTRAQALQLAALAEHRSQQAWLDASQGMNAYLRTMQEFAVEVGRMSQQYASAEGWRRHLHYGFCGPEADPLREWLGTDCRVNAVYEARLESGL